MRPSGIIGVLLLGALSATAEWVRADQVTACRHIRFPFYTVDANSPITDPNQPFRAGDMLIAPGPNVVKPANFFGLLDPLDDLNGLSLLNGHIGPTDTFLLLFSVDRASRGIIPPDPNLVAAGLPFNVQQQAFNGQAAGDAFAAAELYSRSGLVPSPRPTRASFNNVLLLNQGDASGIDYALDPNISPAAGYGGQENNVDGGAGAGPPMSRGMLPGTAPIFAFTVKRGSPSLLTLPGTGSGADIYLAADPNDPNQPGFGQILYTAPPQLNLQFDDDVDSLIVFEDGDLFFSNEEDQIVFSLTRDSPTLALLGASPADMLTTTPLGGIALYASAFELGLGAHPDPNDPNVLIDDDVTMLDYLPCGDARTCLLDFGIGTVCPACPGDANGDGLVNVTDLGFVLANFGQADPVGDVNGDGIVNITDLGIVLNNFGAQCT